jgi:hypothetical protein
VNHVDQEEAEQLASGIDVELWSTSPEERLQLNIFMTDDEIHYTIESCAAGSNITHIFKVMHKR